MSAYGSVSIVISSSPQAARCRGSPSTQVSSTLIRPIRSGSASSTSSSSTTKSASLPTSRLPRSSSRPRRRLLDRVGAQGGQGGDAQVVRTEAVAAAGDPGHGRLDRLERDRVGDGCIGRDRDGNPGALELAQGIEALAGCPDRLFDALAPVVVVLGLVDRADPGRRHACDLLGGRQSAVLDAVAGVVVGVLPERGLDRRDDHLDRRGRLCVRGGLQACRVCASDEGGVLGGLVVQLPGAAGIAHVAVGEVGGPAAEGAVGVELDAREAEAGVAELADESHLQRLVEQMREQVHRDAQRQPAGLREPQVHVELAAAHLGVADRRDAAGEEARGRDVELAQMLLRLVREVEVRAVVADLHAVHAGEDVAGRVRQLAGELAVGVAEELAAGGVRRLAVDPLRSSV